MSKKISGITLRVHSPLFNAADYADSFDDSIVYSDAIPKHNVGPHAAGEVVFDQVAIDPIAGTIGYFGPREEKFTYDKASDSETCTYPYVEGCDADTTYKYQLNISVGAQIATE